MADESTFRTHIQSIVTAYLQRFPDETDRLAHFDSYLKTTPADIRDRKNMDGHLTAGALIVDVTTHRLLLIHHRFLNRMLQPGGHVDPGEMPRQAALREAYEEVGPYPYELHSIDPDTDIPVDLNVHPIPANAAKQESEHFHFDFRYILKVQGSDWVKLQHAEVTDFEWVDIGELASSNRVPGLSLAVAKLQHIL